MGRKQRRARYLHGVTSRLESPGTPPMKLSDAEEEDLEEAARRKPSSGNLASSSYSTSTRENNAHLDTIAEDMVRTKEIKCEERSRVGGGSDVGGLYKPQDYDINRRRTNGKRQSSRFLPSGAKGFGAFVGWPGGLQPVVVLVFVSLPVISFLCSP